MRINDVPPHKRKVNTVFQKYALFTHMNIFENVAFGLRISKVPEAELRERVEEALALVNLAADLASFKNIGIDQASTALKSIFTGETES